MKRGRGGGGSRGSRALSPSTTHPPIPEQGVGRTAVWLSFPPDHGVRVDGGGGCTSVSSSSFYASEQRMGCVETVRCGPPLLHHTDKGVRRWGAATWSSYHLRRHADQGVWCAAMWSVLHQPRSPRTMTMLCGARGLRGVRQQRVVVHGSSPRRRRYPVGGVE